MIRFFTYKKNNLIVFEIQFINYKFKIYQHKIIR